MIIKVPFRSLERTESAEEAPDKILKALKEIWLNESWKKPRFDAETILPIKNDIDASLANIEINAMKFLKAINVKKADEKVIFLGGDHSISYATVKAFSQLNEDAGLIIFDAHADLMPSLSSPIHEDWLSSLIGKGFVSAKNVFLVGLRNVDENEKDFLDSYKINHFTAKEIFSEGVAEIASAIMEIARKWQSFYVSVDIDVCDPAFAPAVAYPEPGGLSSRELLHFLQRLTILKNFAAADIVEVLPKKDINGITVKLAAKILAELM